MDINITKCMKKFNILNSVPLIMFGAIAILSPDYVRAEEYKSGIYGSINIGGGKFSDVEQPGAATIGFDTGFSYEGSLGYDFGKRFRADISYSNTTSGATLEGVDIDAKFGSLMLNGYIDFPIAESKWEPFIGVGLGTTKADMEDSCTAAANTDCTDDVFTFGISGGVNYALNSETDITAKITYLGFDDIEIINVGNEVKITDSETLSATVGIKFKF